MQFMSMSVMIMGYVGKIRLRGKVREKSEEQLVVQLARG